MSFQGSVSEVNYMDVRELKAVAFVLRSAQPRATGGKVSLNWLTAQEEV